MSKQAEQLLEQWGIWTKQKTGTPRYVSPLLALMRDHVPGTHAADAAITDEDAEEVSAILARLNRGYPEVYRAIELYYRHNMTQHQAAERMNIRRIRVRELLVMGEWYVQAALDLREKACNGARRMAVCA